MSMFLLGLRKRWFLTEPIQLKASAETSLSPVIASSLCLVCSFVKVLPVGWKVMVVLKLQVKLYRWSFANFSCSWNYCCQHQWSLFFFFLKDGTHVSPPFFSPPTPLSFLSLPSSLLSLSAPSFFHFLSSFRFELQ